MERLGKYNRLITPGINFMCCPIEYVADKVSMRVQQLHIECETKTLDNVFVTVTVVVQYKVQQELVYDAYYTLDDSKAQIKAYVFDSVNPRRCSRAAAPSKHHAVGPIPRHHL